MARISTRELGWLVSHYGGKGATSELKKVRAYIKEARPTVRSKRPVQQAKGRKCPKCKAETFTRVNGWYQCQECCHWFE